MEQERTEWLNARRKGIGGSDVGAILGLSPFKSPVDVWLNKTGRSSPQVDNDAMWWGRILEDPIAKRYEYETGEQVEVVSEILYDKNNPVLLANIDRAVKRNEQPAYKDGIFNTNKILEIKTARSRSYDWGAYGTDKVPDYYLTQCLHYLGITGATVCDLAALFFDVRIMGIYKIEADFDFIEKIKARLLDWWETYVVADKEPPTRSMNDIQRLYRKSTATSKVADENIEMEIRKLSQIRAEEKYLLDEIEHAKYLICEYLKDSETLTDLKGKALATFKANKTRLDVDWEEIVRECKIPESIILKHTKVKQPNRILRLKKQ